MLEDITLITGASGEIGHGLLSSLGPVEADRLVALDLSPLDPRLVGLCHEFVQGDVLDQALLEGLSRRYRINRIFHLAAVLSARAEQDPRTAHRVNVEGTLNLLQLGLDQAERRGAAVTFVFPSSIAVYGLPSLEAKLASGPLDEETFCAPATIYGANKLYCEHLGRYFSGSTSRGVGRAGLDFRAIRFPGLISADTLPTGGTSDYGPEMLHHAAKGQPYRCFVRPDTRLPFMAMPDAVKALTRLADATSLRRSVYNVTSFSPSAEEIHRLVLEFFPSAQVSYEPDTRRQAIVDSWPASVDDRAAREDWGWAPDYDLRGAFEEYLIPAVSRRYPAAT